MPGARAKLARCIAEICLQGCMSMESERRSRAGFQASVFAFVSLRFKHYPLMYAIWKPTATAELRFERRSAHLKSRRTTNPSRGSSYDSSPRAATMARPPKSIK